MTRQEIISKITNKIKPQQEIEAVELMKLSTHLQFKHENSLMSQNCFLCSTNNSFFLQQFLLELPACLMRVTQRYKKWFYSDMFCNDLLIAQITGGFTPYEGNRNKK